MLRTISCEGFPLSRHDLHFHKYFDYFRRVDSFNAPWCVTGRFWYPTWTPNDHSHHPAKSSEHYYLLSGRLGGLRCPGCQPCAQDTYIFTISEGRHLFYPQRSNNQYLWISRATLFTGQYVSSHMSTYLFRPLLPRLKGGKGLGYICYKRWDILSDT